MVISTERLILRRYALTDAEAALEIYRHEEVTRWLAAGRPVHTADEVRDAIAGWHRREDPERPYLGHRAVTLKNTGRIVGTVMLMDLPPDRVEIGWHLDPAHHGLGYATEAARGLAEHAFAGGVTELFAVVLPGNVASVAVTRRLGMEPLGRTTKDGVELDLFRLGA